MFKMLFLMFYDFLLLVSSDILKNLNNLKTSCFIVTHHVFSKT